MVTKKTNIPPVAPATAVPVAPPSTAAAGAPGAPAVSFPLDAPLRWEAADAQAQKMLENLQGNILKGHGRDHTMNVFFKLGSNKLKCKRALRELGNFHVTSAYKQLLATKAFKADNSKDGGTFCALFISATGYAGLGLGFAAPPNNAAFAPGMKASASLSTLGDPPVNQWESEFRGQIDGMVLVGDDNETRGAAAVDDIEAVLTEAGCTIVKKQAGKAIKNQVGNGLEHFGYVDGRSQPLMLMEDIEKESRDEGIVQWDPTSPLSKALVTDPLANDPQGLSFGSFFIFRKLEEKVRAFKTREQDLADALNLTGEARELAGALVIGRFEDGTPVTLSDEAKGLTGPQNDFNYDADSAASRCPFHGHIRKTNPRGSGGFGQSLAAEQLHIMARRGITYEDVPRVHPDDLPESSSKAEFLEKVAPLLPAGDVGLLFMAYNAQLDQQFVFTQQTWADNATFPQTPAGAAPGLDGVIGQPADGNGVQHYTKKWDDAASGRASFKGFNGFVHMKGGEYFFAPSMHFLRSL